VGHGDRLRGRLDRLQCRARAGMAEVDHHAEAVHLADHLPAHIGEPGILALRMAGAEERLVVVGELQHPHAHLVQDLDEAEIVLDHRGVLEAEEDGGAPLGLGGGDVGARMCPADLVGMVLEAPVPGGDFERRLSEAAMIGHRRVDGIDTAFTHLAEDLL